MGHLVDPQRLLWYAEAVIEMTDAAHVVPGINRAAQNWQSELRRVGPMYTRLAYTLASQASRNDFG